MVADNQVTDPTGAETDYDRAVKVINDLSATYTSELQSKMARLDGLIGAKHWYSVGSYKEALIREQLAKKVPRQFEVGTGFILSVDGRGRVISKQIDVLVWDSQRHSPIFRDGEFVIIPPEACRAAIEVKGSLDATELKEALDNLDSLTPLMNFARPGTTIYKAIFAFEKRQELSFSSSVLNAINAHFARSKAMSLDERVKWSRDNNDKVLLPWINSVAILGEGVVSVQEWGVNGATHICYAAYKTVDKDFNDTYGFLERPTHRPARRQSATYNALHEPWDAEPPVLQPARLRRWEVLYAFSFH